MEFKGKILRKILSVAGSFLIITQSFSLAALILVSMSAVYTQQASASQTIDTETGGELTTLIVEDKSADSIENLDLDPQTVVNNPSVITDKADYAPTDAVVISGTGFTANTTYTILITADNFSFTDTITTDENGGFVYSYQLDGTSRPLYTVQIKDASGTVVAKTTFTDPVSIAAPVYSQCSNDTGTGYTSGDLGCRWINGNLVAGNSTYHEGDSTVQRALLTDVTAGSHTVVFQYDTTKAGKHAYDFLTIDKFSETWVTDADMCDDASAHNFASCASTSPDADSASNLIPVDTNAGSHDTAVGDANRHIRIRNGIIDSVSTPTIVSGTYAGDSDTAITVTFHVDINTCADKYNAGSKNNPVDACAVLITFGAHISQASDWGAGTTAVDISGSPYHVALQKIDGGSIGQRDNQMQAGAIVNPDSPTITTEIHNDNVHTAVTSVPLGSTVHDKATMDNTGGVNGTPTGDVSFTFYNNDSCEGGGTSAGTVALSSGVAHPSSNEGPLGAGSYSFKAHYASSDTSKWNDADSDCEPLTVNTKQLEISTTVHSDNPDQALGGNLNLGDGAHDSATVTGKVDSLALPDVTFYFFGKDVECTNGSTTGGTQLNTLSPDGSGVAHPSTSETNLGAGSYNFMAVVASNDNYTGATSNCEPFTVDKAQLTVTTEVHNATHADKTNGSVPLGSVMHDTAAVTGGVGGFTVPTPTFNLTSNYTDSCASGASVGNDGTDAGNGNPKSADSAALGAGSYAYRASVAGNDNYFGDDSPCEPFTVDASQLELESKVHDVDHVDQTNQGVPLGSVMHDTAKISGGLVGGFTPAPITFEFYSNDNCTDGSPVSNTGADTGGDATRDRSTASSALAAGSYSYEAFVAGNSNYIGTDSDCEPFSVDKADPKVETDIHDADHNIVTSVPLGTTVHDLAEVYGTGTGGGIETPTGNVDFTFYTNDNCDGEGTAAGTVALDEGIPDVAHPSSNEGPLGAGDYGFQAHYVGDGNYKDATSDCEPFTVEKARLTVTTEVHDSGHSDITNGNVPLGSIVHDTASVAGGGGFDLPDVSFTFTDNFSDDCSQGDAVVNDGTEDGSVKSADSSTLAAGKYAYRASVAENDNYIGDDSDCEPLKVNQATPEVTTEVHNSSEGVITSETLDTKVHDKATVAGIGLAGLEPSGNVEFSFFTNGECKVDTGVAAGPVALDGADPGVAHPSTEETLAGAGSYSFKAHYVGDDNYEDADSACEPFTYTTLTINKLANGVGTFGYNVAGPTNATPNVTTTNGTNGSVTIPIFSGSYTVGENDPTPFLFVSLACAGNNPSSPANRTSPSFNAPAGQNTVCNFENTKRNATRTQGFWATHTEFSNAQWASVPSTETDMSQWGAGCTGIIDADASTGQNELMGGFWANIANKTVGGKRSDIEKARMQLLQQLEAALLNRYGLGTADGGIIDTAESVYCTGTTAQIKAQIGVLGNFNQSGDTIPLGTSVPNATPSLSKNQANIPFWNTPKNPNPNL